MSTGITPYRDIFDIDPFDSFDRMFRTFPVDRELRALATDIVPGNFPGGFRIDVEDGEESYVVTAELAGVNKDDIDVEFEDERLTIKVDHKESEEKKERSFIHKETREWSATRVVRLRNASTESITAKLADGILTINVPKVKEETRETKVAID